MKPETIQKNLLLAIDDEPALLDIIQRVARLSDFEVTTTTDPALFRTSFAENPPSVILMDLQMPGCDGIELLHDLAAKNCRATIVLISGFEHRVVTLACQIGRALGLNMSEPIEKPMRPANLRAILMGLHTEVFKPNAAALQSALDNEQLELFYQPLLNLQTQGLVGFEALVRWRHPTCGLLMPDTFIELAEREGLINALTGRVLELAAAQLALWKTTSLDAFVSVNVSAANIVAELPDALTHLCAKHQIAPHRLRLELTESSVMTNQALILTVLTRVRLKGFELAIDDFGTGHSSLVQLYRLPFSELKIDRSFVSEMATSEEASIIVGATVGLAHALKLKLVAEGIETVESMQRLRDLGVETGQGYYYSRPLPAAEVPTWMAAHAAAQESPRTAAG